MRVALGPFDLTKPYDLWPLERSEALSAEGFDVQRFGTGWPPPQLDALVVWSPEYLDAQRCRALRVYAPFVACFLGDHHVRVPDDIGEYDLIATDWKGTKLLRERGIPEHKILWWRGFSYDPRLHSSTTEKRTIDIAFMGRPTEHRKDLLRRIAKWGADSDHTFHFMMEGYARGDEATIYRQSRVVIGDSQRGELQMRAYESIACGALYVCQMDTDEIWQANAPIPTYQTSEGMLEAFLESWLEDDSAREAKVKEQAAWVAKEKPIDHLRYLLRAIKQRMGEPRGNDELAYGRGLDRGPSGDTADDLGSRPGSTSLGEPTQDEQRPECLALIPATATRILDLGCNGGGAGWRLKLDRPGVHVTGVDADPAVRPLASSRLDAFYEYDFNQTDWAAQPWYRPGEYDAILLFDVAEHVGDPWEMVKRIKPLLAPGGVVVASIPQLRNSANLYDLVAMGNFLYYDHAAPKWEWRGPHDNVLSWGHLRCFTRNTVARLFTDAGYRITRWESSRLHAPSLDGWTTDLAALIGKHAGADNAQAFREEAAAIQYLVTAEAAK